jgi:hypothetical protein
MEVYRRATVFEFGLALEAIQLAQSSIKLTVSQAEGWILGVGGSTISAAPRWFEG